MIDWKWILVIGVTLALVVIVVIASRKSCPNNCSGNGTCDSGSGQCACNAPYVGDDCSKTFDCKNTKCKNAGTCNSVTGVCVCQPGFEGADCSVILCPDCGKHGICNKTTGKCACQPGWKGEKCDIAMLTCNPPCDTAGGTCNSDTGKCDCNTGYEGELCNIKLCNPPDCSGHGICNTTTGICVCSVGYVPPDCKQTCASCQRGVCNDKGVCVCDSPWLGLRCDQCPQDNMNANSGCVCPIGVTCNKCASGTDPKCICDSCTMCEDKTKSFRAGEAHPCTCDIPYTSDDAGGCKACLNPAYSFETECQCKIGITNPPACNQCMNSAFGLESGCKCPVGYVGASCNIPIPPYTVENLTAFLKTVTFNVCSQQVPLDIVVAVNSAVLSCYTVAGVINYAEYIDAYCDIETDHSLTNNQVLFLQRTAEALDAAYKKAGVSLENCYHPDVRKMLTCSSGVDVLADYPGLVGDLYAYLYLLSGTLNTSTCLRRVECLLDACNDPTKPSAQQCVAAYPCSQCLQ